MDDTRSMHPDLNQARPGVGRDDAWSTGASASASSSSSSSSASRSQRVDIDIDGDASAAAAAAAGSSSAPTAGAAPPVAELVDDDPLPISPHDGGSLHNSYLVRFLRFFNCGLQDLRLLLMVLPCLTVILFVQKQPVAGAVVLALTLLLLSAVCWRLALLIRARRHQLYHQLPSLNGQGGLPASLGAAMHMHVSARGGRLGHGRVSSSLLASARLNPTALQLAMMDRDFTSNDYDLLLRLDAEHAAQSFTGVPASAIDRLPSWRVPKPTGTATKPNVCSVCLEDQAEGEMVRTLMCMHTFHQGCIDTWLQAHSTCPVCQWKVQLPAV